MYFREMKFCLPHFACLATTCFWQQQLGTEIEMMPIILYCLTWLEFIAFTNRQEWHISKQYNVDKRYSQVCSIPNLESNLEGMNVTL